MNLCKLSLLFLLFLISGLVNCSPTKFPNHQNDDENQKNGKESTHQSGNSLGITRFEIGTVSYLSELKAASNVNYAASIKLVFPFIKLNIAPGWRTKPFMLYEAAVSQGNKYEARKDVKKWTKIEINPSDCLDKDDKCASLLIYLPGKSPKYRIFFLKFEYTTNESKQDHIITFRITYDPLRVHSISKLPALEPQETFDRLLRNDHIAPNRELSFVLPEDVFHKIEINNKQFHFSNKFLNLIYSSSIDNTFSFKIDYTLKDGISLKRCTFQVLQAPYIFSGLTPYLSGSTSFTSTSTKPFVFKVPIAQFETEKTHFLWIKCDFIKNDDTEDIINIFAGFEKANSENEKSKILPKVNIPFEVSYQNMFNITRSILPDPVLLTTFLKSFSKNNEMVNLEILSKAYSPYFTLNLTPEYKFKFDLTLHPEIENFIFSAVSILYPKWYNRAPKVSEVYECDGPDCLTYVFDAKTFSKEKLMLASDLKNYILELKFALTNGLSQATWSIFFSI